MLVSVNNNRGIQTLKPPQIQRVRQNANQLVSFRAKEDTVEKDKTEKPIKFKPVRSFIKGFFQPVVDVLKAVIEKPAQTAVVVGVTGAIVRFIKPARLILAGAIAAYGSFKIGSGLVNTREQLKQGDKAQANKEVERVGEGVFDVGLTVKSLVKGVQAISATKSTLQAMAVEGKHLTTAQKVYAFLTLPTKQAEILKVSKDATVADVFKLVGKEGVEAAKAFKEGARAKVSERVTKIQTAIKNGEAKTKVKNFANTFKNLGQLSAKVEEAGDLVVNAIDTLDQMDGVDLANFLATVENDPDSVGVVKELYKRKKLDKAAEKITGVVGNNPYQEVTVEDKIKPLDKKKD